MVRLCTGAKAFQAFLQQAADLPGSRWPAGERTCRAWWWLRAGAPLLASSSLALGGSYQPHCSSATAGQHARWPGCCLGAKCHNTFGNLTGMNMEPKLELLTVQYREWQQETSPPEHRLGDASRAWLARGRQSQCVPAQVAAPPGQRDGEELGLGWGQRWSAEGHPSRVKTMCFNNSMPITPTLSCPSHIENFLGSQSLNLPER